MIDERQEQNFAERAVSKRLTGNILSRSFLTASLLTGNTGQAEKAVLEAIKLWNPDEEDEERLFQITLRTAVQPQIAFSSATSNNECTADSCLPIELRRVLRLSPEIRSCFVLRVLVGLPSNVCAEVLDLDIRQLDRYCCDAMENLAALDSFQGSFKF